MQRTSRTPPCSLPTEHKAAYSFRSPIQTPFLLHEPASLRQWIRGGGPLPPFICSACWNVRSVWSCSRSIILCSDQVAQIAVLVSVAEQRFFFFLLLFFFFFFMTSMIYGSHNTLCPAKNVAVLFSTRQLSYKKTQFSIAHLRKKGKLHNAVATCILDKRAKIFPASHKWARRCT